MSKILQLFLLSTLIILSTQKTITFGTNGQYTDFQSVFNAAQPGDVIEILEGTYTQRLETYSGASGTVDNPIIFRPAKNAKVIIDGSSTTLSQDVSILSFKNLNYVNIEGPIEIKNSNKGGVEVIDSQNVKISGLTIHDTQKWGMVVSGDYIEVENNEVYNCVLDNTNSKANSGWSSCMMSWARNYNQGKMSSFVTWKSNKIYNGWGEGLNLILCENCVAKSNTVTDAFSVLLYMDNARNVLIDGNILRQTDDSHNNVNNFRACGIAFGNEDWMSNPINTENITIANNLIIGTRMGFGYWSFNNYYYTDIKIYHNTMWNTLGAALYISSPKNFGKAKNCEAINNFLYIQDQYWSIDIGKTEKSNWVIKNNYYYGSDNAVSDCQGKWTSSVEVSSIFKADPKYDCKNAYFKDLTISENCFYPSLTGSELKNGLYVNIAKDFFGCDRNKKSTTIGFSESSTCGNNDNTEEESEEETEDGENDLKYVTFEVQKATSYGQSVIMIGEGELLGNWAAKNAKAMTWTTNNIWVVKLNADEIDFESFKFAVVVNGVITEWSGGSNKSFKKSVLVDNINNGKSNSIGSCSYTFVNSENNAKVSCSF